MKKFLLLCLCLCLCLILISGCKKDLDINIEDLNTYILTKNEYGNNYKAEGPIINQELSLNKDDKIKINISGYSDTNLDYLNICIVDLSQEVNYWKPITDWVQIKNIIKNNNFEQSLIVSITDNIFDITNTKIIFSTYTYSKLNIVINIEIVNETKNEEIYISYDDYINPYSLHYSESIQDFILNYKLNINNVYDVKQCIMNNQQYIYFNNDVDFYNYSYKSVDTSWLYNKLDLNKQEILKKYDYIYIYDCWLFYHNKKSVAGVTDSFQKQIFFCKNPRQTMWINNLSYTERTLIHEMAHALTLEEPEHYNSLHDYYWCKNVEYIIKNIFINNNDINWSINDIINKYNFKYEDGVINN